MSRHHPQALWEASDVNVGVSWDTQVAWSSMPFTTGHPKLANSGRRKGTPNRLTGDIAARLEALGCDPIEGMARLAMDEENTPELRGRMYAELSSYLYPKRKSVELASDTHSGVPRLITVRYEPSPTESEQTLG